MTELRLAYQRARKNARKRIAYAKLKGFNVDRLILPEGITAKTPDIEVLEKIKALNEIGITAIRNRMKTPAPTRSFKALDELRKEIEKFSPLPTWSEEMQKRKLEMKNTLQIMLEGAVMRSGIEAVGERLESSAISITFILDQILYDSDQDNVNMNLNQLAVIINGEMTDTATNKALTELSDFIQ